jgi:putative flippase GtrA
MQDIKTKFLFLTVGGVAFLVDMSVYLFMTEIFSMNVIYSRVIAFLIAVCVTCIGNRTFTFNKKPQPSFLRQYAKAILAAIIAFLPNILLFWGLLTLLPNGILFSLIAFVLGTGVGIVFNYILSSKYVFTTKPLF